jgi:Holliday junction resolvase RusA-like endonuclease
MSGGVFVDDREGGPEIELHLPCPPSVNETRRIDMRKKTKHDEWCRRADQHVMVQRKKCHKITGPFEIHVIVSEKVRLDLDNVVKHLIDYLVNIEFVPDDRRKYLRKLTVHWGVAPEGVLIRVKARPPLFPGWEEEQGLANSAG